jgi:two-component system sensor histidine kinase YesM
MRKRIFIAFVVIVLLPTLLALAVITHLFGSLSQESTLARTRQLIGATYRLVDTSLEHYEQLTMQVYYNRALFDTIAEVSGSQSPPGREQIRAIDEQLQSLVNADRHLSSVYLVTEKRRFEAGTPFRDFERVLEGYEPAVRAANGRVVWSRLMRMTSAFGRSYPVVFAMRALREDNETIGILSIALRESLLAEATQELRAWDDTRFSIYDSQGRIVYSEGNARRAAEGGPATAAPATDLSQTSGSAGFYSETEGGETRYIVYERSHVADWLLTIEVPESVILGRLTTVVQVMWLLLALLGVFLVLAVYLLSVNVTRPLMELDRAIGRIGQGDFDVRLHENGPPEVTRLIQTVNSMAAKIRSLVEQVEREAEMKKQAELRSLRLHLSPHFLYNTLNTLRWIAKMNGQHSIKSAVESLLHLLKYISKLGNTLTPLREELSLLRAYLDIQRLRYDEFAVDEDIPEELQDLLVLPMLLQPVAENSIIHGLAGKGQLGRLQIRAWREGSRLCIRIADNGQGYAALHGEGTRDQAEERHTGIETVEERIRLNHGAEYGIILCSARGEGSETRIELPAVSGRSEA